MPDVVEQKLREDLYDIFAHRCGFDVTILLEYETEPKYKKSNNEDFYIEQQIKNILKSAKKEEKESDKANEGSTDKKVEEKSEE